MPSQFGGIEATPPAAGGSLFGGIPAADPPAQHSSNLERFAQAWWDNSVLRHPIDSAVSLVKSLVTMPDYHTLSQAEKDAVDEQMTHAVNALSSNLRNPTPEYSGMVASKGTNAAVVAGATMGLAKGLGAAVDVAPQAWAGLKAAIPAAAPDVAAGTAKGAAAAVLGHYLPSPVAGGLVEAAGVAKGAAQAGAGLVKGARAFRQAYQAAAAPAADAAPAAAFQPAGLLPPGAMLTDAPADTSFVRGVPAEYGTPAPAEPVPPRALLPAAPAPALVTPAPADASFVRGVPAEYGTPAQPEPVSQPAMEPAATAPEPPPSDAAALLAKSKAEFDAQRLEDEADWIEGRKTFLGESRTWDNRAAKADRFARFLTQNKLDPTPENLARATRELVEADPPSDKTTAMIEDRMKYTAPQASSAAASPETEPDAPSELEQQLRDSLAQQQQVKPAAPAVSDADALRAKSKAAFNKARRRKKP